MFQDLKIEKPLFGLLFDCSSIFVGRKTEKGNPNKYLFAQKALKRPCCHLVGNLRRLKERATL